MEEEGTVRLGRGTAEGFGPGEGRMMLGFGVPALVLWAARGKDTVWFGASRSGFWLEP